MSNHSMSAANEERAKRELEHNRALRAAQVTWDKQRRLEYTSDVPRSSTDVAFHGRNQEHYVWAPFARERSSFIEEEAGKPTWDSIFPWPRDCFDDNLLEAFVYFINRVHYDFRESTGTSGIPLNKHRDVRQAVFHGTLYLLFHHFGVHLGPPTAMRKFLACIKISWNHPHRFMDIVGWAYEQSGPDDLRQELIKIVLERQEELSRNPDFRQLMKKNDQFRSELVAEIRLRYTPIQGILNDFIANGSTDTDLVLCDFTT